MDPDSGLCTGCLRTLDEIGAWSLLDDEDKRAVWRSIASRRSAAAGRTADASASGTEADGGH